MEEQDEDEILTDGKEAIVISSGEINLKIISCEAPLSELKEITLELIDKLRDGPA